MRLALVTVLIASSITARAAAQQATPAPKPAAPNAAASAAEPPAEEYTYHADGRRDPFLSLLNTGNDPRPVGRRAEGVAGLLLSEISVRGVMESRDSLVAMIAGPDNKTYVVHTGDKLMDGTIKNITHDGLVVTVRVRDPLSTTKERDIQKLLRSLEDAK